MAKVWKIGLPMYLNTEVTRNYYRTFLTNFIDEMKQLGFDETIEIVEHFPEDIYQWWLQEDILLTQTCGYPFKLYLESKVQLVATPCYAVVGCDGAKYSSVFITSEAHKHWKSVGDAKGQRVALNLPDSNSGMNVLRAEVAQYVETLETSFFNEIKWSGGHMGSLKLVQENQADLAAIDCVTFAYAQKYAPETMKNIHILGYSQSTYALPYISSNQVPAETIVLIKSALKNLILKYSELCEKLFIQDFYFPKIEDYQSIIDLQNFAKEKKYVEFNQI